MLLTFMLKRKMYVVKLHIKITIYSVHRKLLFHIKDILRLATLGGHLFSRNRDTHL